MILFITVGSLTAWMLLTNKGTRPAPIGKTDTDRISDRVHSARVQNDVETLRAKQAGVVQERAKLLRAYERAK